MHYLREFVFANERHPESGRAVSLARNGDWRLRLTASGEIRGDPRICPKVPPVNSWGLVLGCNGGVGVGSGWDLGWGSDLGSGSSSCSGWGWVRLL